MSADTQCACHANKVCKPQLSWQQKKWMGSRNHIFQIFEMVPPNSLNLFHQKDWRWLGMEDKEAELSQSHTTNHSLFFFPPSLPTFFLLTSLPPSFFLFPSFHSPSLTFWFLFTSSLFPSFYFLSSLSLTFPPSFLPSLTSFFSPSLLP